MQQILCQHNNYKPKKKTLNTIVQTLVKKKMAHAWLLHGTPTRQAARGTPTRQAVLTWHVFFSLKRRATWLLLLQQGLTKLALNYACTLKVPLK
jgi:hypothetical protein